MVFFKGDDATVYSAYFEEIFLPLTRKPTILSNCSTDNSVIKYCSVRSGYILIFLKFDSSDGSSNFK